MQRRVSLAIENELDSENSLRRKKMFRKHRNSVSVRSMQTCIFETSMKFTIEFEIERNNNDDKCFDTSLTQRCSVSKSATLCFRIVPGFTMMMMKKI